MIHLTRIVFGGTSLLLVLLALGLIGVSLLELRDAFTDSARASGDAILDALGYVIVAIAVFDVAKYLFEEEVTGDHEKRSAAEARRSLTKFLSTIVIALFLEGLVVVFKTARADVALLGYPTALVLVSVLVLVGLGVYQRLSAIVEVQVGDDDDAAEAEEEAEEAAEKVAKA
ncbi:GNAT family acetyltransferase [uncultured Brevundimonas sp.]|uniref:GNAT family acetyltransferase n=1 Tax=uncultured Brevundimonas sp. TaxID=213418 RepID=UPI0030EDAEEF|tara:strand:+ start:585 stop:1100 length:516 start_codon:yes stop_codon:yes gene_type:complete